MGSDRGLKLGGGAGRSVFPSAWIGGSGEALYYDGAVGRNTVSGIVESGGDGGGLHPGGAAGRIYFPRPGNGGGGRKGFVSDGAAGGLVVEGVGASVDRGTQVEGGHPWVGRGRGGCGKISRGNCVCFLF